METNPTPARIVYPNRFNIMDSAGRCLTVIGGMNALHALIRYLTDQRGHVLPKPKEITDRMFDFSDNGVWRRFHVHVYD